MLMYAGVPNCLTFFQWTCFFSWAKEIWEISTVMIHIEIMA